MKEGRVQSSTKQREKQSTVDDLNIFPRFENSALKNVNIMRKANYDDDEEICKIVMVVVQKMAFLESLHFKKNAYYFNSATFFFVLKDNK